MPSLGRRLDSFKLSTAASQQLLGRPCAGRYMAIVQLPSPSKVLLDAQTSIQSLKLYTKASDVRLAKDVDAVKSQYFVKTCLGDDGSLRSVR